MPQRQIPTGNRELKTVTLRQDNACIREARRFSNGTNKRGLTVLPHGNTGKHHPDAPGPTSGGSDMKSSDEFHSSFLLWWRACVFSHSLCARLGLCQVRSSHSGAPSRTAAAADPGLHGRDPDQLNIRICPCSVSTMYHNGPGATKPGER